jgi:arginine decarboxylase
MMHHQHIPNVYFLCAGSSEGKSALTSFDGALLTAGVGNVNLIRVSSILPPACREMDPFAIPKGSLVPIAYATKTSSRPGEIISSAIAIAIPEDNSLAGVIMEHSDSASLSITETKAKQMVEEAMEIRNIKNFIVKSKGSEIIVNNIATTFAGTVLWRQ